jgi:L-alanine-DL-glutamate epimerase-like enolase superfamily enzyme
VTPSIAAISTTVFSLPMEGELKWGKSSRLAEVRHVLVQVHLSDGSSGVAEAPPRPTIYGETEYSITSVIAHELAPRLIGKPVDQLGATLAEIKNNHTARGAIDMAVHDALAQGKGISLAEQLGSTQERMQVSYILGIGDRDAVLAEAERVVAQGVRVLKVKVGRTWEEDLGRIRDLQQMFGAGVALYADANECMQADEAPHKLAQLAEMGLLYCEEPLPVELIRERAMLRAGQHLPLIADDSAFTARDLARELSMDTFDVLNIKTPRTGYTESLRMLAAARAAGKGVMVGSQAGSGLGTARAAIFAALPGVDHPSELSFFLKLKEDIVARPLQIRDGYVALVDALTVSIDPANLAKARIDL